MSYPLWHNMVRGDETYFIINNININFLSFLQSRPYTISSNHSNRLGISA